MIFLTCEEFLSDLWTAFWTTSVWKNTEFNSGQIEELMASPSGDQTKVT